jgi:hypothetical protein
MDFQCEAPLLAKKPETCQHFFQFCVWLPRGFIGFANGWQAFFSVFAGRAVGQGIRPFKGRFQPKPKYSKRLYPWTPKSDSVVTIYGWRWRWLSGVLDFSVQLSSARSVVYVLMLCSLRLISAISPALSVAEQIQSTAARFTVAARVLAVPSALVHLLGSVSASRSRSV